MSFFDASRKAILGEPTGVILYGPPRTRRGRLANRVRRLFGREEQMTAIAEYTSPFLDMGADTIKVSFDSTGYLFFDKEDTVKIGNWIRRPGGKWHVVESVVDGDAVTRCGRRMDRELPHRGSQLHVSETMPLTRMIDQPQLCKGGCDR